MQYTNLDNNQLKISKLCFGSWALSKKGWKGVNQAEAVETLEMALEQGVNFIDTAPIYGFGQSEEIVGKTIKNKRSEIIVATKCGLKWNERGEVTHDLSEKFIKKEIQASLKRLGTGYIDIYQVHWPDPGVPFEETFSALNSLKKSGIVRYIGLCNFSAAQLQKVQAFADILTMQNCYNYLQREVEEDIIPYCKKNNIGFLAYSPLAQGLLSESIDENYSFSRGDVRRLNPLFSDPGKFLSALNKKKELGRDSSKNALQYLSKGNNCDSVIISMTKPKHLYQNIKIFSS